MGKNTGRGFRWGAVRGRSQTRSPFGWIKIDTSTGRFLKVKKSAGPFKGVRKLKKS